MDETLVTVATSRFVAEADALQALLANEGIDVYLMDAHTVAMDWLLGNAIGNIKLQVPTSQVERAGAILRSHNLRLAEIHEGDVDAINCLSCGAALPDDEEACPVCGWSFQADTADDAV